MRSSLFIHMCFAAAFVSQVHGQTETTALWLFDEPVGCYPSTTLTDNGPQDITVVLGRGAVMAPGRFGNALAVRPPQPLKIRGHNHVLFGLGQAPTPAGRTVAPMTWESANFAAFQTRGERHLRHMEFANATATRLNLGAFDWTVECWVALDRGAAGEGTLFEIGEGPRGESDHVTRLGVEPAAGQWILFNQPSASTVGMPSSRDALGDGEWHHVAFVYGAATGRLAHYVDGRRMPDSHAVKLQALAQGDEAYFSIGRDGRWERPFPGRIDELRFSTSRVYEADFTPPASFSRAWKNPRQPVPLKAGPPLLFPPGEKTKGVLPLGTRKHVFLDDALIDQSKNIEFALQPPSTAIRVHEDVNGHTSVVEDEDGLLRLYYRGPRDSLAVMTSRDGVKWQTPDLGREYAGARNIVVRDAVGYGNVILDPNAPPAERWKYVSGGDGKNIFLYWSANGWNFTRGETTVIPLAAGSQSTVFYDDQRQLYVGHHRSDYGSDPEGHTRRMFMLTELKDLMMPWPFKPVTPEHTARIARTLPVKNDQLDPWFLDNGPLAPTGIGVEYPVAFQPDPAADLPGVDMYVPKAIKYPWAPDAYVAFPTMFFHYDSGPDTRKVLGPEGRLKRGDGPTECQLAVSRDGVNWRRLPRPAYIGIGRHDGKNLKMIYSTYNLVRRGDELWHYFLGKDDYHGSSSVPNSRWDLYRVTQRLDGFVAAQAPISGGRLVTKPLTFTGNRLRLNIDTDAVGYAQGGFLDERGQPIPGYYVQDCVYVNGDAVGYEVEWLEKGKDVSSLAGKTVQLVFELHGAKLYALQFQQAPNSSAAVGEASASAASTTDFSDKPSNPAMRPINDIPGLPRVLLIGDSISIGYTVPVRDLLKGVANVHRIPENGGPTSRGSERLDGWLGTNNWDVIHFNWGLHDLKIGTNGQRQVELERYERNLERLLDRLQRTGATLVWATTTPVPEGVKGPRRDPADVPRYNDAARRVMDAAGVRINDLNAFAQPRLARIQIPQNVHSTPAGSAELANPVARAIREALKQRRSAGSRGLRSPASPSRDELAAREKWVTTHLDPNGDRLPFTFQFDGRASTAFLKKWPVRSTTRKLDAARTERTLAWTDPRSGLAVRCVAVEYADYPAVEWTVHIKNTGASDTPILENIQGLDTSFERGGKSEFVLHGIKGDFCAADSYEPYRHTLTPNWKKQFSPPAYSGKSCDGPDGWPYYNLQMPGGGVILAVGWPGQWASSFTWDARRSLRITASQQRTHLVLKPGEEIRTPLIALLFWKGDDVVRAQNLWRRWFIAHNLARTRGQTQPAVAQIQVDGSEANIADVKAFLDAGIKPDICWRDAGGTRESVWFEVGPDPLPWQAPGMIWLNSGTWEVDKKRFPQGFKPFSDWARSNGMQFLLWFEPERVGDTNSWLAKNHPEWLLPGSSHGSILNLGNPTALAWLVNHLDSMIQSQGLDWYREDMNGGGPLPTWRRNDAPDRQGITENFYVQGHLALWDELRRKHPGLRIDSCASGGRRNDLETMRRAVPLLRSDFQFPEMKGVVEGNQGHTLGLSSWLPFQGTGCYLYEPYAFRSFYLPSFGMGGLTPQNTSAQKQAYSECARVAPLMLGDFYPLTPHSLKQDAWVAWQFDRPELGIGVVQAFRRRDSSETTLRVRLGGLTRGVRYEVENLDGGKHVATGRQLMETGLQIVLADRPSAAVFPYRRLGTSTDSIDRIHQRETKTNTHQQ